MASSYNERYQYVNTYHSTHTMTVITTMNTLNSSMTTPSTHPIITASCNEDNPSN